MGKDRMQEVRFILLERPGKKSESATQWIKWWYLSWEVMSSNLHVNINTERCRNIQLMNLEWGETRLLGSSYSPYNLDKMPFSHSEKQPTTIESKIKTTPKKNWILLIIEELFIFLGNLLL